MFFLTFVGPGDEVVMADPTFSLFPADAIVTGATPVRVPLRDGVHDLDAMLAAVTPRTKAVVICDPNNPSATCVEPEAFSRFASALPANVLLFIDQAYREYMPAESVEGTDYVKSRRGTIVTRTMSKLYGLASVRFGYGFADQGMIDLLQRVRVPFNVSSPAAHAARAALDDDAFRTDTIAMNDEGEGVPRSGSSRARICSRTRRRRTSSRSACRSRPKRPIPICCGAASSCAPATSSGCRTFCASRSGCPNRIGN